MSEADRFSCAAIVLAAGSSSRLGQPKQILQIDGESLLRRALRAAQAAEFSPILVVLGFEHQCISRELAGLNAIPVINPEWQEGMGSSLRCGMEALLQRQEALLQRQEAISATAVLVCDQPGLSEEHLRRLAREHFSGGLPITASSYGGGACVPALFSDELFPELCCMGGDRGARDLIRRYLHRARLVEWPNGELDIDRPADVERIKGISGW